MTISTKLHLNTFLSLAVAILLAFVIVHMSRTTRLAAERARTAAEFVKGLSELHQLTFDYLLHRDPASLTQWHLCHESIRQRLEGSKDRWPDEQRPLLGRIASELAVMDNLFDQMTTGVVEGGSGTATGLPSGEWKQRLFGQFSVRSQILISDALTLDRNSHLEMVNAERRALVTVMAVLMVGALATAAISMILRKSILRPLAELHQGTEIVAGGNLDYETGRKGEDEIGRLAEAFDQMTRRLRQVYHDLDQRIRDRTLQLEAANRELEAFAYSVSHDLRAPLRRIDGFSQAILEDCADRLDDEGRRYLHRVREGTRHMGELIDALLTLSRVTRSELNRSRVDLSVLAQEITRELQDTWPERTVSTIIEPEMWADADPRLLRIALENLFRNAWKFTRKNESARIEFATLEQDGKTVYFVADDGAGFDMRYAERLFGVFQRLHSTEEFEGTGVGLALVQRIVHRHGGEVWAEGAVDGGACVYFTLG